MQKYGKECAMFCLPLSVNQRKEELKIPACGHVTAASGTKGVLHGFARFCCIPCFLMEQTAFYKTMFLQKHADILLEKLEL